MEETGASDSSVEEATIAAASGSHECVSAMFNAKKPLPPSYSADTLLQKGMKSEASTELWLSKQHDDSPVNLPDASPPQVTEMTAPPPQLESPHPPTPTPRQQDTPRPIVAARQTIVNPHSRKKRHKLNNRPIKLLNKRCGNQRLIWQNRFTIK